MARREQATGLPAWRMEILSPSVASFQDFSSSHPDLPALGHSVIDNDYLALQHRDRIASGWAQGRGPKSGQNIVEANTLVLHLTWLHEPLLPGLRQLVKILAPSGSSYGSRAMAVAGYLPIRRQVSLLMQSHPIAGNLPSHGRVVRQGQAAPAGTEGSGPPVGTGAGPGTGPGTARSCTGLWCLDVLSVGRTTGGAPGGKPLTGAPSASEDSDAPPGLKPAGPDSAGEPGTVPPGLPGHDTLPETPHWPPDTGSPPTGQESGGWPGVDDAAGNGFDDAENEAPPLWDDMCPGCCD